MGDRLVVFGWHNVDGTPCFPSPPRAGRLGLAAQLSLLRRLANVVPLGEAVRRLRAGERLPPRSVALTFDDGYRDNLTVAVPLLERLGLPATFFLVPGLLSRTARPWWEVLASAFDRATVPSLAWEGRQVDLRGGPRDRWVVGAEVAELLKQRDRNQRDAAVAAIVELLAPDADLDDERMFLDWDGARALVRRGFDVGSHSMWHAILSRETAVDQERDLSESRAWLARELGVAVPLLAYPNGTRRDYTDATVRAAVSAGHLGAVTTVGAVNRADVPAYEVRRYVVYPEEHVAGLLNLVRYGVRARLRGTRPAGGHRPG